MPDLPPIAFAAMLGLLLLAAEAAWRDRPAQWQRWPLNLALGAATALLGRALAIIGPVAAAIWAERLGFGLFNSVSLPMLIVLPVSILLMDLAVWYQHRQFHERPWFWRWHRLHHADPGLDLSTAVRFHPMEALISLAWKSLCVAALGIPPAVVPLFELWLMAGSLIEHSNVRLSPALDRVMRQVWVTPAMHRVHHSAHGDDSRHNYGFAISIWDRLFGSYRPEPGGPQIGLPEDLPVRTAF